MDLAAEYARRLSAHRETEAALSRRHILLGNLRLAVAAVTVVVAVLAFVRPVLSPLWLVAPLLAFAGLAVWHSRVLVQQERARHAASYVELGLARLQHKWHGLGATHTTHLPTDHPYAEDLDLFGPGSLFDLLSTARTTIGETTLAGWLLEAATPDVVAARQDAVRDLATRHGLREDLAVLGPALRAGAADTASLAEWASTSARPVPLLFPTALAAMSIAAIGGVATWVATGTAPSWLAGVLTAQAVVGLGVRRAVRATTQHVDAHVHGLTLATELVARIEQEEFTAGLLRDAQARLRATGVGASVEIGRFSRLVQLLAQRRNQFFGPLAALLFWATQLAWAIDRWRARAGGHVPEWLRVVGDVEALSAMATFAAERSDAVFPTVEDGEGHMEARDLRHPLLPADTAVGNDLSLGGSAPHLVVVSGSNMSGKSTWLRTVGVNVVLAQAGAPVCATSMSLSPLLPAGTLRVQDSLQSGRSRFFAEITKLRQIVDLAKAHTLGGRTPTTLFLLDELLAGTNSHDRRQGAAGVLRGLVALGAIGLATTHDLAVTDLATTDGVHGINVHLADRFEQGGLEFDYRVRPGVVATSNALALMRSIGLDV